MRRLHSILVPLVLLALAPFLMGSAWLTVLAGSPPAAASSYLFEWHGESATVTSGTPAGSSVGDTTGTAASSAAISAAEFQDGSNSISIPTSGDYYEFTWSNDIIKTNAGTIDFYFKVTTYADQSIFYLWVDASNRIYVTLDGAGKYVAVNYNGGGSGVNARTNINAFDNTSGWFHCKVRWDTTIHGSLYMKVTCDQTTGESNSNDNGTSALPTFTGTSGTFNVGDYAGVAGAFFLDNIKVYSTWQ